MRSFAERQASRLLQEDDQFLLLQLPNVRARFEEKVIPEPNSGCFLWMAAVGGSQGHGQFYLRKSKSENGLYAAHRCAWMMYVGKLNPIDLVCHSCDTPSCVKIPHHA